jgi:hypothetical protein
VVGFAKDNLELSFGCRMITGPMIVVGRLVVFAKQITLRLKKEKYWQEGERGQAQVHRLP